MLKTTSCQSLSKTMPRRFIQKTTNDLFNSVKDKENVKVLDIRESGYKLPKSNSI